MNVGGFIIFLIGLAIGGILGIVLGLYMADQHWKHKICPYCDRDYVQRELKRD